MHFVIYCQDDPATPNAREENYPAHRAHLAAATVKLLVAGPYTEVNSDKKIGSMLVVEADSIEAVRDFAQRDPFFVNRVWNNVQIHPYIKSTDNR
ncbi:YciI family protein [Caballeronia sp. LZ001]|uniref:YciI family protein n=1 Tax=Caballeronia sp. LZ001 TaxID=3038553 RepID=UPI00285C9A14|nr:YciI family protein [Caballeronia sp. LZ001]MDR5804746.1 YciI family protein [Caballeronia sp. LZ001]